MGIKRDGCSLRVGVSHCWSDAGSSNLVFPTVVSRPYLRSNERAKAVQGCFERSAAILKQHHSVLLSFHALSRAEGHRLGSNKEVADVCDLIQEAGYDHPFEGISPGYVPEKDWLPFLKYVKHAPNINPEEGKDYLDAADRWRQEHGYPLPPDDAGFASLVERTLLR